MPSPAELLGRVARFVGEVLGSSSLRFDIGPTLVTLGIVLILLQLVARPVTRWVTADAAGLAGIGRAMALAAESGTDVVVSLGGGGVVRATDALARLQSCGCHAIPVVRDRQLLGMLTVDNVGEYVMIRSALGRREG